MNKNGFTRKWARSTRYPTETIADADYANDQALPTRTPVQAESLLDSLEAAARGLIIKMRSNNTGIRLF